MKRFYKVLATACAMVLIVASPMASMTTHAIGFNAGAHDTTDYGEMPDGYWDNFSTDDSSSNSSEPAPAEDNSSYSEPSHDSGSSDNSSSSYDDSASSDSSSSNSTSSSSATVSTATTNTGKPAGGNNWNNVTVHTTDGQSYRIVMTMDHTIHEVYHCGISKITFQVTNAYGNVVNFNNVVLEQGEDGLWYENFKFAEGTDTTEFTVNVTKGDATYLYTELGVSGIKINGVLSLSTVPVTE